MKKNRSILEKTDSCGQNGEEKAFCSISDRELQGKKRLLTFKNLWKCYIRLSCRALPLILKNGWNEEVLNPCSELHRARFSGEVSCQQPPCRVHRSKLTNYNRTHFSAPHSHSRVSDTGSSPVSEALRCPPEATSANKAARNLIRMLQIKELRFDLNIRPYCCLLLSIGFVSWLGLIGSI